MLVPLDKIEIDRSTQARLRINKDNVQRLVDVLDSGGKFSDDVELYLDDAGAFWVGDGFHRLEAYEIKQTEKIWARVRPGTHEDALAHAVGANDTHGLPRSRQDVRRAIKLALEQWPTWNDRSIGRIVHCDGKTVGSVRKDLGLTSSERTYTDRYGNEIEMNVDGQQNRQKKKVAFTGPANSFHHLPANVRENCKALLRNLADLDKTTLAFVRQWLASLPDTRAKVRNYLTTLEVEEDGAAAAAAAEDGADRLLPESGE
jgi:hypothetical protein